MEEIGREFSAWPEGGKEGGYNMMEGIFNITEGEIKFFSKRWREERREFSL